MKAIYIIIMSLFLTGCMHSIIDTNFQMQDLVLEYKKINHKWPSTKNQLKALDSTKKKNNINWNTIYDFSIHPIAKNKVKLKYSINNGYFSKYRFSTIVNEPKITIQQR